MVFSCCCGITCRHSDCYVQTAHPSSSIVHYNMKKHKYFFAFSAFGYGCGNLFSLIFRRCIEF